MVSGDKSQRVKKLCFDMYGWVRDNPNDRSNLMLAVQETCHETWTSSGILAH